MPTAHPNLGLALVLLGLAAPIRQTAQTENLRETS